MTQFTSQLAPESSENACFQTGVEGSASQSNRTAVYVSDRVQDRKRFAGGVELDPLVAVWVSVIAQLPVVYGSLAVDEVEIAGGSCGHSLKSVTDL